MPKTAQQLWEEMEDAKVAHRNVTELFLKVTGWTYSSSHPDHCWRWTKEFNGLRYSFNTDDAARFETRVTGFNWPCPEG